MGAGMGFKGTKYGVDRYNAGGVSKVHDTPACASSRHASTKPKCKKPPESAAFCEA
jgi:hypothetical protein